MTSMTKEKWGLYLGYYWTASSYREMLKAFRKKDLPGCFFGLAALASLNSLVLAISKFYELSRDTEAKIDFGDPACDTLAKLKDLAERGAKEKGSKGKDYRDSGVFTFRNLQVGHPVTAKQVVNDSAPYIVSLEWQTIDETMDLMSIFVNQVEAYHREKGTWTLNTHTAPTPDVEFAFGDLIAELDNGAEYARLLRSIAFGVATVAFDPQTRKIKVVKDS